MNVNPKELQNFLSKISYVEHGDTYEQKYGHYLSSNFPNCEKFWKSFVVPMTKRMDSFSDKSSKSINLRNSIAIEIEDIANAHYSMFLNLIFAHIHLDTKMISSFENVYVHLGSACDLAETVMGKWHLLLLECQKKPSHILQKLNREDFLKLTGKWYDENYPSLYEHYLSKGKSAPIHLISQKNILVEYFGKKSQERKAYAKQSQLIRTIRNVVVHDLKIGRIAENSGKKLIPKPAVINRYRTWRDVAAVLNDDKVIKRDFVDQYQQAERDIAVLEQVINNLWKIMLDDFTIEFYDAKRNSLRSLFSVAFFPKSLSIASSSNILEVDFPITRPSGTYSGGTAIYRREDDDDNN